MKKIIVATDFSESAAIAVLYATDLAVELDADLVLFYACQPPLPISEVPVVVDTQKEIQKATNELEKLKYELDNKVSHVIDIHYRILAQPFFEALSAICRDIQPYLVVLGSQGTTSGERLLLGGHAVQVMKQLPWPVITVPVDAGFKTIQKIGLACDLHDVAELVPAEKMNKLVSDLKAELHVLNIGKPDRFDPEVLDGSETLTRIAGDIKPVFHFLTGKNTDEEIVNFINQTRIDLLIVLPRRHGFIHGLLHRSHTKYFVLHSDVPVLALQQGKTGSPEQLAADARIDINDIM